MCNEQVTRDSFYMCKTVSCPFSQELYSGIVDEGNIPRNYTVLSTPPPPFFILILNKPGLTVRPRLPPAQIGNSAWTLGCDQPARTRRGAAWVLRTGSGHPHRAPCCSRQYRHTPPLPTSCEEK